MAAVLRVKRRYDEEPLEALVLACKKRKANEDTAEEADSDVATVYKFATTVKEQERDVSLLLPINDREDIWKSRLRHKVDIVKKLRDERKKSSENSRYKVVNCFRHAGVHDNENADKKNIIVYDIESSKPDLEVDEDHEAKENNSQYVYDIYYGHTNNECDFTSLDHILDIMPVTSFDFGSADGVSDESVDEDDEDSNDESNWRNDYPDSDHSVNEEDMRLAMEMGDLNLDNELSSSDDELIYGVEGDPQDVEYYGIKYAKYKARVQNDLNDEIATDDEESIDSSDNKGYGSGDDEIEDPILRYM